MIIMSRWVRELDGPFSVFKSGLKDCIWLPCLECFGKVEALWRFQSPLCAFCYRDVRAVFEGSLVCENGLSR